MMQEIGFVLKMLILSSAYINCFSYVLVSDGDGLGCPGRGRILGEKKRGVYSCEIFNVKIDNSHTFSGASKLQNEIQNKYSF